MHGDRRLGGVRWGGVGCVGEKPLPWTFPPLVQIPTLVNQRRCARNGHACIHTLSMLPYFTPQSLFVCLSICSSLLFSLSYGSRLPPVLSLTWLSSASCSFSHLALCLPPVLSLMWLLSAPCRHRRAHHVSSASITTLAGLTWARPNLAADSWIWLARSSGGSRRPATRQLLCIAGKVPAYQDDISDITTFIIDAGVLLRNIPCVKLIWDYIRDPSGIFWWRGMLRWRQLCFVFVAAPAWVALAYFVPWVSWSIGSSLRRLWMCSKPSSNCENRGRLWCRPRCVRAPQEVHEVDTAGIRVCLFFCLFVCFCFFAVRSPRFLVRGYCTKWWIQWQFSRL